MSPTLFSSLSLSRPGEIERSLARTGLGLLGVDEAGRGALAGPVVAAAVALPEDFDDPRLNDSKQVSRPLREELALLIARSAVLLGVGEASPAEIDSINILQATFLAMRRAIASALRDGRRVGLVLVDGPHPIPDLPHPQKTFIKGDARSTNIAAASIIAKTERDRIMTALHGDYPEYGFDRHVGYGTALHLAALARIGPSPVHRRTFGPVRLG